MKLVWFFSDIFGSRYYRRKSAAIEYEVNVCRCGFSLFCSFFGRKEEVKKKHINKSINGCGKSLSVCNFRLRTIFQNAQNIIRQFPIECVTHFFMLILLNRNEKKRPSQIVRGFSHEEDENMCKQMDKKYSTIDGSVPRRTDANKLFSFNFFFRRCFYFSPGSFVDVYILSLQVSQIFLLAKMRTYQTFVQFKLFFPLAFSRSHFIRISVPLSN